MQSNKVKMSEKITDNFLNQITAGIIYTIITLFAYQFYGSDLIILYMPTIFRVLLVISALVTVYCIIVWCNNKEKTLMRNWSLQFMGLSLGILWILNAANIFKTIKILFVIIAAYFVIVTVAYILRMRRRPKTR